MNVPIDAVMRALAREPHGATVRQLAATLGMEPHQLSGRLSKQFLYGRIDRTRAQRHRGARFAEYVYRVRP